MPLAQIMEGIEMFEDKGQKELIEMVQTLCIQLKGRQGGETDSENTNGFLTYCKEEWLGAVGHHPWTDLL